MVTVEMIRPLVFRDASGAIEKIEAERLNRRIPDRCSIPAPAPKILFEDDHPPLNFMNIPTISRLQNYALSLVVLDVPIDMIAEDLGVEKGCVVSELVKARKTLGIPTGQTKEEFIESVVTIERRNKECTPAKG